MRMLTKSSVNITTIMGFSFIFSPFSSQISWLSTIAYLTFQEDYSIQLNSDYLNYLSIK
jgi:hypothetical protein